MKTAISAIALSFTMLGAAYATEPSGELDYPPVVQSQSTVTRAQVQAELQAARAAGQVTFGELEMPAAVHGVASASDREQVAAEAHDAQVQGQSSFGDLDYQHAEYVGAPVHS